MKIQSYITMMWKLSLTVGLIVTSFYPSFSQFVRDDSGNPEIDIYFFEENLKNMIFEKIEGGSFSLNDNKDKIIIIDFWQTWCGPCVSAFKGFEKAKLEYPDKIEIIAASPDWADKSSQIKRFIKKHQYSFEFVWAKELGEQLQLSSIPYKIIITPNGEKVFSKSGTEGPEAEYNFLKDLIDRYFQD